MNHRSSSSRIEIIRAVVDDTARNVQQLYLTFLFVTVYLAIAVSSTTDEQLLRESSLPLPILGVSLPIKEFYIVVPIAITLLHMCVSGGANVHQSWRFENDQAGERDRSGGVAA